MNLIGLAGANSVLAWRHAHTTDVASSTRIPVAVLGMLRDGHQLLHARLGDRGWLAAQRLGQYLVDWRPASMMPAQGIRH